MSVQVGISKVVGNSLVFFFLLCLSSLKNLVVRFLSILKVGEGFKKPFSFVS